jgi:uncharacterized membrane protein YfcA
MRNIGSNTLPRRFYCCRALFHRTFATTFARPKAMDRRIAAVLYAAAMAAVIVGVDLIFFRNRFWERLIVNIGIVLVFGAFYMRFFMPP